MDSKLLQKNFPELLLGKIAVTAVVSVEFYTNLYVVHYSTVAIAENFGGNLGKFGNFLRIRQSFIRQLLVISEKARGWA